MSILFNMYGDSLSSRGTALHVIYLSFKDSCTVGAFILIPSLGKRNKGIEQLSILYKVTQLLCGIIRV